MDIKGFIFTIAVILLLSGCDILGDDIPKISCDCAPSGLWQFDLVTGDASQNSLVFGPNTIYVPDGVSVYSSSDSTRYELAQTQPGAIEGNNFVTILNDTPQTITISADSVTEFEAKVEYTDLNIECCPGTITQITFRDSVYKHEQGVFRLVFD